MKFIKIVLLAMTILITFISCVSEKEVILPDGWENIRPPNDICSIVEQGDIIWAGGKDGVYKIDRRNRTVLGKLETDVPLGYVKAIILDNRNILWIGHDRGLIKYDGKDCYNYTEKDGLPDNRVNALLKDKDGSIWVGTWKGAAKKTGETWKVLTAVDGLLDNMVNTMLQDSRGYMWFGSYTAPKGGLSCFKDGKWTWFSNKNGLPHNNINALLEDKEGRIFAATGLGERGGAGVIEFRDGNWSLSKVIKKDDGLAGEKVRSLFQDSRGLMWLGSEYDGVAYSSGKGYKTIRMEQGLVHNEAKTIIQDVDGNLWIGTKDGITFISAQALKDIK